MCSHRYYKFDDLSDLVMSIAILVVARFCVALMTNVSDSDQSDGHRNYVGLGSWRVITSKINCSLRSQTKKVAPMLTSAKSLVK